MYKIAKPFFIVVETPLHAGSGTELGVVDMPIQRERHTSFPKVEGSGLKGSIREAFEELRDIKTNKWNAENIYKMLKERFPNIDEDWKTKENGKETTKTKSINGTKYKLSKFEQAISLAFGPEEGDEHAGALGFTDARILLFPVKSMRGVFAYITCPMVLERFKADLELCKNSGAIRKHFLENKNVPSEKTISNFGELGIKGKVILEEYTFDVKDEQTTKDFAIWLSEMLGIDEIKNKLVILPNDDFRDFVNLSTEVITRTKISAKTGTVEKGALFTEEYLPTETILYSLALTTPIFKEKKEEKGIFVQNGKAEEELVMEFFKQGIPDIIQIGGNATIGKGIVRIKKWEDKNG